VSACKRPSDPPPRAARFGARPALRVPGARSAKGEHDRPRSDAHRKEQHQVSGSNPLGALILFANSAGGVASAPCLQSPA